MKLYIYDHCPFCTRARMAFALRELPVELTILMEGDSDTPTRMVGKKVVPILGKEDGSYMKESLDIVHYVDRTGTPMFADPVVTEIDTWIKEVWPVAAKLFIPRFTQADFAELSTPQARAAYRQREEEAFGDLDELMARTPDMLSEISPKMSELAQLLAQHQPTGITDILLWPVLRCLSIVKALPFPPAVREYAERLEARTGISLLFNQAI